MTRHQLGEIHIGYCSEFSPVDVFNNILIDYRFEEFADDTKTNDSIL